jgi:hypothetical protein
MGFKIEQQAADEPKYCDYIQEKIDIAKKAGAVYELVDEDYRIQALYDQEELTTKDKIVTINRVRSNDDGKEYLVVNKFVDFYDKDDTYKDRYVTKEGLVELPLKTINSETGATEVKQTRLKYTVPFSAGKVDDYLETSEDQGSIPTLTFYDGAVTSNRLPSNIPTVANAEYFKEASWTELQIGREKKVLNSLINRLPEVRKELKDKNSDEKPVEKPVSTETKQELNKEEKGKDVIVEPTNKVQPQQQSKFGSNSGFGGSGKKN